MILMGDDLYMYVLVSTSDLAGCEEASEHGIHGRYGVSSISKQVVWRHMIEVLDYVDTTSFPERVGDGKRK